MLILNDIHISVNRSGGTTPSSREALREYLFTSVEEILHDTTEKHVCILGDLFDQFEIEGRDWIRTYLVLQDAIVRGIKLTLVAGNHDWSPKGTKVSSFEMLCKVLTEQFGTEWVQVIAIDQWASLDGDNATMFALAHCSNQETFDAKLQEMLVMPLNGCSILLHANYDNGFTAQSDHSLNVTRAVAKQFVEAGATLYFAHEHQARVELDGKVVVFGNQWPTSVADCLNNDYKYAHILRPGEDNTLIRTWARDDDLSEGSFAAGYMGYGEIDWQSLLGEYDPDCCGFVKVVGTASSNQAGDCLSAIAKFRAKSKAFVITNGVKIEGVMENEDLPDQFEATKKFDVMEFINSNLDSEQQAALVQLQKAVQQ